MSQRTKKFKEVLASVNEVLHKDWAPIGFVDGIPKDEYESFAIHVVSMLASGAKENELATYLANAGYSITGNQIQVEECLPVAKRLLSFREVASAIAL